MAAVSWEKCARSKGSSTSSLNRLRSQIRRAHPSPSKFLQQGQQTGERIAEIEGDLEFHGANASVTLYAAFNGAGTNPFSKAYTIGFAGETKFKRSDFGIGGSVAKIVKLEHAWRRLDGRNDDGFQVAPFPG